MYVDHTPAVSGERWMSGPVNPPPVMTAVSDMPANDQSKQLQSQGAGHGVMPAQSNSTELQMASSAAATYEPPYQAYNVEQRSGSNLAPYSTAAVGQVEDWKQQQYSGAAYDGAYRSAGNADDMQGFPRGNYNRENEPPAGLDMGNAGRGVSNSALRQPASTPGSSKKTVTFHENIATEYAIHHHSYGSTSSDSSFVPLSPPETSGGYDSAVFPGPPVNSYGLPVPR